MHKFYPLFFILFIILFLPVPGQSSAAEMSGAPKYVKLSDVSISSEAYELYYRQLFEDCASQQGIYSNSMIRLNELFGTYRSAYIHSPTHVTNSAGLRLPVSCSVDDIVCTLGYRSEKVAYEWNGGYVNWITQQVPYYTKTHTKRSIRQGYIHDCTLGISQTVRLYLDHRNVGTIVRSFRLSVRYGSRIYDMRFDQTIYVTASCPVYQPQVTVPGTQQMCGPIVYEADGNVRTPGSIKPVTMTRCWPSACGTAKVLQSYKDYVSRYVNNNNLYLLTRTWTFIDYCTGQKTTATQKIVIDISCGKKEDPPKPDPPKPDPPTNPNISVPGTQRICVPIKYDENRNIVTPNTVLPVKLLRGWSNSCGLSQVVAIYDDQLFKYVDQPDLYVLSRTWTFYDDCTGKKASASQKIVIDSTCKDEEEPEPEPEPDPADTLFYELSNPLVDLDISTEVYEDLYEGIINLALETFKNDNPEIAADLIDAIFGGYKIGDDSTHLRSLTIKTSDCVDGSAVDTSYQIKNGMIRVSCPEEVSVKQNLKAEFDKCGTLTGLIREFLVEVSCDTVPLRDTLTQRINISPACPLGPAKFTMAADTVVCGTLELDSLGRPLLPIASKPVYSGPEIRYFTTEYKYTIIYTSDEPYRTEVERIWVFTDTCTMESARITQQVVLVDTCGEEIQLARTVYDPGQVFDSDTEVEVRTGHPAAREEVAEISDGGLSGITAASATVYPNPFTHQVHLNFETEQRGRAMLRILDVRGSQVFRQSLELEKGVQQLSLTSDKFVNPGIYIIQIVSGEQMWNQRVVYQ